MLVVVARTAAAAAGGGRTEATEVGGLPGGRRARSERHPPLELAPPALGASDLGIGADELLELGVASGAAIGVNGHAGD